MRGMSAGSCGRADFFLLKSSSTLPNGPNDCFYTKTHLQGEPEGPCGPETIEHLFWLIFIQRTRNMAVRHDLMELYDSGLMEGRGGEGGQECGSKVTAAPQQGHAPCGTARPKETLPYFLL